jgi:phosphate binding protein
MATSSSSRGAFLFAFLLPAAVAAETVRVKGSDTIGGALGPDLAESYHAENPETLIEWEALGSSTAFVGLFDGTATLGASSRPIQETESLEAKRRGLQLREWVFAYDGIAILVHPSNSLPALTIDEASKIFQGRIRNFDEVGGPDRPIRILARPSYSGTHAFFREKVLRKGNSRGPEEFAPTTEFVEHSAEIVQRVADDPNAISFLGLGWAKPSVRAVPVAASRSSAPVAASIATVRDGSYPIFRALYLYTVGEPAGETRNLLAYILSEAGQKQVVDNGFVRADITTTLAYRAAQPSGAGSAAVVSATTPLPDAASSTPVAPARPAESAFPSLVRVFFATGGTRITDEAELRIENAARQLRGWEGRALVVGHADSLGSRDANDRVSAARAGAVYQELRRLGIPSEKLSVQARGASEPIATNNTTEGRGQNRRVDIVFVPPTNAAK